MGNEDKTREVTKNRLSYFGIFSKYSHATAAALTLFAPKQSS